MSAVRGWTPGEIVVQYELGAEFGKLFRKANLVVVVAVKERHSLLLEIVEGFLVAGEKQVLSARGVKRVGRH